MSGQEEARPRRFLARPRRYVPSIRENPAAVERMREATALCDEPESITPLIADADKVRAAQALAAREATLSAAWERRPTLSFGERLAIVERRAKACHADLARETRNLRHEHEKARLKGKPVREKFVVQLAGLEELLDRVELRRVEDRAAA